MVQHSGYHHITYFTDSGMAVDELVLTSCAHAEYWWRRFARFEVYRGDLSSFANKNGKIQSHPQSTVLRTVLCLGHRKHGVRFFQFSYGSIRPSRDLSFHLHLLFLKIASYNCQDGQAVSLGHFIEPCQPIHNLLEHFRLCFRGSRPRNFNHSISPEG